jgi:putative PEP-CTERM system histidine kinase
MPLNTIVALAAALCSMGLAVAILFRQRRTYAGWLFCAGMTGLALESLFGIATLLATDSETAAGRLNVWFLAKLFVAAIWLSFSLTFSRGNFREFLYRWRYLLTGAFLLPTLLTLGSFVGYRTEIGSVRQPMEGVPVFSLSPMGTATNILLLIAAVIIVANLEKTFRAAVGTMRWRIKFIILGLSAVFATRIYTHAQSLLYTSFDPSSVGIDGAALLIGCGFLAAAHARAGLAEIDVYPSQAVLGTSITVLLTGAYLFAVGVLAQVVAQLGGAERFQIQAFLVLLGIAILAVLLLSERVRDGIQRFVSVHFKRPRHDSRKIWTKLTHRTANVLDRARLCDVTAKLISETFNALSVTVWLLNDDARRISVGGSTSQALSVNPSADWPPSFAASIHTHLAKWSKPFDLDKVDARWGATLRQLVATQFRGGGHRVCIPLLSGENLLGIIILADRVNGIPYSEEELELLKCIGDQCAASLLNLRLNEALVRSKEFEAFQTMSAFFVHDLKNAAATLSLMLKNLPVHFSDPAFREDALRGIGQTVTRINQLIERLRMLRQQLELNASEFDVVRLVSEAMENSPAVSDVEVVKHLEPVKPIKADRQQMLSVITNLLLNAREALNSGGGRIEVSTSESNGFAVITVADNGCGMSATFVNQSLFKPFRTTKKKGLGIGMFQSKMIVEAHRGGIEVESEPGKGTTFRVLLPMDSKEIKTSAQDFRQQDERTN